MNHPAVKRDIAPSDLQRISTEQRNPRTSDIDRLATLDLVRLLNEEDASVPAAVATVLPTIAETIDLIADRFGQGGRLIYVGAGTSGRLGVLDASECPPTYNVEPGMVIGIIAGGDHALRNAVEQVEDDPDAGAQALREIGLTATDVVVGIAASGRTPFVLGAMAYANDVGAVTACIANSADSALERAVDHPIVVVTGPEPITGSTRMKAGTAQKLVLNMLSTGAMIRIGKTFGNLMVDLQAKNAKLRARSIRIVALAAGIEDDAAAAALASAGGDVKVAIVSLLTGTPAGVAETLLNQHGGHVGDAIGGDA